MSNNNSLLPISKADSSSKLSEQNIDYNSKNKTNHYSGQKIGHKQAARNKEKQKPSPAKVMDDDYFSQRIEQQLKQGKKLKGNNKKNQISINHLLEFQSYRDSKEYQSSHSKPNRRRNSSRYRDHGTSKINLHGMAFINVHYKFIVDNRQNYNIQMLDPNVPVEIKDIVRIIVPKGNACPICLSDEPVAPRMITSCGHILCLTCMLSLLESEVPKAKKRESSTIVEKYKDCPLCGSIIRRNEVKPVLINDVDERFETPKVNDEVVLTLMKRSQDRILALPNFLDEYNDIENFPWIDKHDIDFSQYSRILKGDLKYILDMYEIEKQQISKNYENEKLLYNEDRKYVDIAIQNINKDIEKWSSSYEVKETCPKVRVGRNAPNNVDNPNNYYYYQTGFNASSVYVLSPLDMKVLKKSYNEDYSNLPSSIIAKIENIKYEELNSETSLSRFKYLSHLPLGTSIGFLECNWSQNEYITKDTWESFKNDLTKRTTTSARKLKKEEKNRKRALNEEEVKNRTFFERENNSRGGSLEDEDYMDYARFGSLSIVDHRELPSLATEQAIYSNNDDSLSDNSVVGYQTTIWGTKIPKAEVVEDEEEYDWDAEEMIRRAKEEMNRHTDNSSGTNGKKKKKKLVLLSSNSNW